PHRHSNPHRTPFGTPKMKFEDLTPDQIPSRGARSLIVLTVLAVALACGEEPRPTATSSSAKSVSEVAIATKLAERKANDAATRALQVRHRAKLTDMPLSDFVEHIGKLTKLRIRLDGTALKQEGIA